MNEEMAGVVIEDNDATAEYGQNESSAMLSEHLDYRVGDSDIANKYGNYVFTIGNVSSGKSTLQNMLVYRLWSHKKIKFKYSSKDGDHRHDHIMDEWIKGFMEGKLPDRTKQGILQEFSVTFGQENRRGLELSFLEISGEDIKSIVPTMETTRKPTINKSLEKYLSAKKNIINKRFIFVSDSEENKKNKNSPGVIPEDILFNHFLTYLLSQKGLNMKKISILFVAAKWDLVKNEYSNARQYFTKNFPQSMSILKTERCDVTYIPFSVGVVEEMQVKDSSADDVEVFEKRIVSLEGRYVDLLIQWLYGAFTGGSLNVVPKISLTLWDRFKLFLGGKV